MHARTTARYRFVMLFGIGFVGLAMLVSTTGCVRLAANLFNAIQGNERPPEYDGFKGKKVAVVCGTDRGLGVDETSALLIRYVHAALNTNIKDIQLVRPEEVERWVDEHGWTESDYVEVGKGVKADQLLAIDVARLSLKDGATLYVGKCDLTVTVYDIQDGGAILYRKQIPEFMYPTMGGTTVTDVSEAKFRARFTAILANKVAGLFYPVDPTLDVALDATSNTF